MNEGNGSTPAQSPGRGTITMKWWQLIVAIIAIVTLSVGITMGIGASVLSNAQSVDSSPKAQEHPQKSAPKAERPKTNGRGNLVKRIGEKAAILKSANDSTEIASWTVNSITLDVPCVPAYERADTNPANGHFVVLDVSVETTSDYDESQYGSLALGAMGMWKYIQKDGTQWNGRLDGTANKVTTYTCLPEDQRLPSVIGPGVKAEGKILFDLPSTDGYLVFTRNGTTGWEYPISERSDV